MRLNIDDIRVGKRIRQLNESVVSELADSIQTIGLLQPISVSSSIEKREGQANGVFFDLVAGLHRLSACRMLGWEEIDAIVLDLTPAQRELWEIDENLCRSELTVLERGEHLIRRRDLYEEIYPQAKRGGHHRSLERFETGKNPGFKTFREDVAERLGKTPDHVSYLMASVENIDPKVRDAIRDSRSISDTLEELRNLSRLDAPLQRKAVAMVEAGQVGSVREARKMIEKPTKSISPSPKSSYEIEEKQFNALIRAWNAAAQPVRDRFLAEIDRPVADNTVALRVAK